MNASARQTGAACPATRPPSSCPRCGNTRLDARHCKLLCLNCGYVESCEDLFEWERPETVRDITSHEQGV